MTIDEVDAFLTTEFDLVPDPLERGSARTYFWRSILRHPVNTTRTVRVFLDTAPMVSRIHLCVSSDNNNSVFVHTPFDKDSLRVAIAKEIALLQKSVPMAERQ